MLGCSGGVFFSQPQQDESFKIELFFFEMFIISKKFELDFRGEFCSTLFVLFVSSMSNQGQFNQPANYLGSIGNWNLLFLLFVIVAVAFSFSLPPISTLPSLVLAYLVTKLEFVFVGLLTYPFFLWGRLCHCLCFIQKEKE